VREAEEGEGGSTGGRRGGGCFPPEPEGEGEDGLEQDWEHVERLGVDDGHHHHAQETHHLQHVPS
jgi:hypothetical protein